MVPRKASSMATLSWRPSSSLWMAKQFGPSSRQPYYKERRTSLPTVPWDGQYLPKFKLLEYLKKSARRTSLSWRQQGNHREVQKVKVATTNMQGKPFPFPMWVTSPARVLASALSHWHPKKATETILEASVWGFAAYQLPVTCHRGWYLEF